MKPSTTPAIKTAVATASGAAPAAGVPDTTIQGIDLQKLSTQELRVKLVDSRRALAAIRDYHATTKAGPTEKREAPLKKHQDMVEALEVELSAREDTAATAQAVTLAKRRGFDGASAGSVEEVLARQTTAVVEHILEVVDTLDPLELSVLVADPTKGANSKSGPPSRRKRTLRSSAGSC
jgi:predicted nucleic acid-binding Zn ribbon protein